MAGKNFPEKIEDKFLKSVGIRQGFEASMLDKIVRQNEVVFDLTDRLRNGTLGQPGYSAVGDDKMGVNVGDVITNTNYYGFDPSSLAPKAEADTTGDGLDKPKEQTPEVKTPEPEKPVVKTETPPDKPPVQPQQPVQPTQPTQPVVSEPIKTEVSNQPEKEKAEPENNSPHITVICPPASAPPAAPTSTVTQTAPVSRTGILGPALAAVVGLGTLAGVGAGMYALGNSNKTPPSVQQPAPVVIQPNRPDTIVVKPENPVQSPGLPGPQGPQGPPGLGQGQTGGWKLGATVSKPDTVPKKKE